MRLPYWPSSPAVVMVNISGCRRAPMPVSMISYCATAS